jgi:DNA repair protein RadC
MYRIQHVRLALVREGTSSSPVREITSPQDAYEVLRPMLADRDREVFAVVLLNTRHRVTGLHIVSIGTINASLVHPRETFSAALLGNAAAVILAHNHPSGDPEPSHEDLALTSRLKQAGELLGIPVLDHLIVGHDRFLSLKERGLL